MFYVSSRDRYGQYLPGPRHRRRRHEYYPHERPVVPSRLARPNTSWLDGELKQGPAKKDIEDLESTTASPATRSLTLSPEEAFVLADQALQGHVRAHVYCLDPWKPMTTGDKKLMPFKIFNEIDREFFRSILKGNVSLVWCDLKDGVLSLTRRAGTGGNPRTQIMLSPQLLQHGRSQIFTALIHHMIHAYYLHCCGDVDNQKSGEGYDLRHGLAFLALRTCIGEHCRPLVQFVSQPFSAHYLGRQHRVRHFGRNSENANGIVSSCYFPEGHYDAIDTQEWRNTAVAKTASLQEAQKPGSMSQLANSQLFPKTVYILHANGQEDEPRSIEKLEHPREAYLFLRFEDRHYPVLRSAVADLAALSNSPHFKDKAFLQLPPKTRQEDFLAFALFLIHKSCPASWKGSSGQMGTSCSGAPAIKAYDPNAPKPLLQLYGAFQLEDQLKYKPFRDHVLNALRNLQTTTEDPMAVLEKIYDSPSISNPTSTSVKSADPRLREWVRTWLATDLISPDMGQYERTYKTNLGVLRDHQSWSLKFAELRGKSSAFGEDENAANDAVCRKFWVKTIRDIPVPVSVQQDLARLFPQIRSPLQSPPNGLSWYPPSGNLMGPEWSNINPFQLSGANSVFNMSNVQESLPLPHLQSLKGQNWDPTKQDYRPSEWQPRAAMSPQQHHQQQQYLQQLHEQQQQQQQQQSRDGCAMQGPSDIRNSLHFHQLPDVHQWGVMGNSRPGQ
ncbi:MAG: hypothetical protein Q9169_008064 [Polycauliona sp. 2 TL-2023]